MYYEWDPVKADRNRRKHGIDFPDAIGALEDPWRLEVVDDRFEYGEVRLRTLGMAVGNVLFVVTAECGDDWTRIISARKATGHEAARYHSRDPEAGR